MRWRTAAIVGIVGLAGAACGSGSGGGAGSGPPATDGSAPSSADTAATAAADAAPPTAGVPAPIDTPAAADAVVEAPSATPAPTTASISASRTLVVSATGDVLPHSPLWRQATRNSGGVGFDFAPMFAEVAPRIASADLSICHLETPIAPEGEELSTDPLYGVPPAIADAIAAAGFDRCSTASNHTFDRGTAGIDRTVDVLESVGVAQSGMARTPEESTPPIFEVNGISVGHLSYSYGFNGNYVPPDEEWRAKLIDPDRIVFDAIMARGRGAEVVVVSLHWGTEGEPEPNSRQREVAEIVTASGEVDLVVGHHAHVLQPIEQVNGVWVAFGLGNVLSNHPVAAQWPASSQDAAIVEFEVTVVDGDGGDTRVEVGAPRARPTWVDKENGFVIRDVLAGLADPGTPAWRREHLEWSLERTSRVIGAFVANS